MRETQRLILFDHFAFFGEFFKPLLFLRLQPLLSFQIASCFKLRLSILNTLFLGVSSISVKLGIATHNCYNTGTHVSSLVFIGTDARPVLLEEIRPSYWKRFGLVVMNSRIHFWMKRKRLGSLSVRLRPSNRGRLSRLPESQFEKKWISQND